MTAEPLSRDSAVFLLVDHQTGGFERVVKAPPRDQVEANVVRLARAAAILDLPAIFTACEEEGPNGAPLPALEEVLPAACASRIDRHGIIGSLAAPAVEAVAGTGRRQLITAWIGTEVCGVAPALHAPPRRLPGRLRSRCLRFGDRDRPRHLAAADGAGGHHADHHRPGERRAGRRLPQALADHAGRLTRPDT